MHKTAYEMIDDKKRGRTHASSDLQQFVEGFADGRVSDAEMAAWLMAVHFQGLEAKELAAITDAMLQSGEQLSWNRDLFRGLPLIDKHSSGGVGDKTTLIVLPILAATGVPIVKLSGRGLGHTGGTLDKLESVPGLRTDLSLEEIEGQLREVGLYVGGQTAELVPADKAIYNLRDKTATADSIPLIASSIMSKKLAAGADAFVFDIKVGKGAFMKDRKEGEALAKAMAAIAKAYGKNASFVLSRMDSPLGDVGNAIEVNEAYAILRGSGGNPDLKELCLVLATEMHRLCFNSQTAEAREAVEEALSSGDALKIFNQWLQAQAGNLQAFFHLESEFTYDYYAKSSGIITGLDAKEFGLVGHLLGTGPMHGKAIDSSSGFVFDRTIGDPVFAGQRIFQVRYEMARAADLEAAMDRLDDAIRIEMIEDFQAPDIVIEILRLEDDGMCAE